MMKDLSYYDIRGNKKSEQETANSYVIREPGNYCLPLVYGCGIKDGKINKDSYTVFTIPKEDYEFIQPKLETHSLYYRPFPFLDYKNKPIQGPEIQKQIYGAKIISFDHSREFIKNLRIKNGYLEFTVLQIPEEGANYIIGALDKSSRVVWSWHLWLWKDELQDIEVGENQDITLLSENLGTFNLRSGIKLSWLYQWGRKDPLYPGKGHKKQRAFESIVTVGESIMNPDIMYGDRMLGFWLYDKESVSIDGGNYCNYWNSKYWQENKVEKTIYDPCPPGYHVPEKYAFQFVVRDGCSWSYRNLPPHLRFPQILDYDKNKFIFEKKPGDYSGIELITGYMRDFSPLKYEPGRAIYLTAAKDGFVNNVSSLKFDYDDSKGYIIAYYIYGDIAAYIRPQKERRP